MNREALNWGQGKPPTAREVVLMLMLLGVLAAWAWDEVVWTYGSRERFKATFGCSRSMIVQGTLDDLITGEIVTRVGIAGGDQVFKVRVSVDDFFGRPVDPVRP